MRSIDSRSPRAWPSVLAWALAMPVVLGCAEDPAVDGDAGTVDVELVMSTAVITADEFFGLVFPVETLDETRTIPADVGLEIPAGGWIAGIPGTSSFLVVAEGNLIQQWTLDADGRFVAGETFSLAGFGVTDNVRAIRVLDETRGWLAVEGLLVEFDPGAMAIVRSIELTELSRDGWTLSASLSGRSYLRGESLFFGFQWYRDGFDYRPEMGLAHIDLASGDVTVTTREECGEVDSGYVDEDGDIYWVTGGRAPLQDLLVSRLDPASGETPTSCLVRLPAGSIGLDDAEVTDLTATEGIVAAELAPLGGGGLIRVLDQAAFDSYEVTEDTTAFELAGAGLWTWQRFDPDTLTRAPLEGLPSAGVLAPSYPLRDGSLLPGPPAADFSSTTYYRVDLDGSVTQSITLPGAALGVFEL
ncbi:MAG TPA: hypothetical protein RMH99_24300 [Sandaracinaceae bacterium LLY-WYZ-13_1]|nr:hypothetical protein [Sandaracinaceae bacterium LLY-WYZ-13_1]